MYFFSIGPNILSFTLSQQLTWIEHVRRNHDRQEHNGAPHSEFKNEL